MKFCCLIIIQSYETASPIYTGAIVANYTEGATIQVEIQTLGPHNGGPHSFHICEASYNQDPTQECLDSNPLKFVNTGLFSDDLFDNVDEEINGRFRTYTVKYDINTFKIHEMIIN